MTWDVVDIDLADIDLVSDLRLDGASLFCSEPAQEHSLLQSSSSSCRRRALADEQSPLGKIPTPSAFGEAPATRRKGEIGEQSRLGTMPIPLAPHMEFWVSKVFSE
eukprot:CAMPEP_0115742708 /NCGR_PEP_ID=MMETSP0272-20121206/90676_1 /TAXON_ID=71861 /ORGANISM="Scrippsiella trochoidea, Strain CCMP3099" /LENGTH=105 /DNA_ID=CAMNT_0003187457 /DNA_START=509 /DNA_END=826 /DNA_ORIENTATION=+